MPALSIAERSRIITTAEEETSTLLQQGNKSQGQTRKTPKSSLLKAKPSSNCNGIHRCEPVQWPGYPNTYKRLIVYFQMLRPEKPCQEHGAYQKSCAACCRCQEELTGQHKGRNNLLCDDVAQAGGLLLHGANSLLNENLGHQLPFSEGIPNSRKPGNINLTEKLDVNAHNRTGPCSHEVKNESKCTVTCLLHACQHCKGRCKKSSLSYRLALQCLCPTYQTASSRAMVNLAPHVNRQYKAVSMWPVFTTCCCGENTKSPTSRARTNQSSPQGAQRARRTVH